MKKESQHGTREQALALQKEMGVSQDLCGPWFHGTRRNLRALTNKGPKVTWFTRSRGGGIPWGPYIVEAYVVEPLDEVHFDDCGAGDFEGKDPDDPTRGLPKWWLKVRVSEIDKLMVVGTVPKDGIASDPDRPAITGIDYVELKRRLAELDSIEENEVKNG